ncbi:MAG: NADPH-dependent oxidoreductase [Coriobacteriia bacterium]|nr:NADPH-dependent oxidoreductase [Coriobacteriia bacterium]
MALSKTIEHQLNHRTYRELVDEPLDPQIIHELLEVARQTATSTGKQQASIIRVTDPELKKEIAKVSNQEYVGRSPELWIFIVDIARNAQIAEEHGMSVDKAINTSRFFAGYADAVLMVQNVYNAVESLGLGGVILASILNDVDRIIELLQLPKYTYPALGLSFGKPNQNPQLKPRMDMKFRVFENSYKTIDKISEALADYDEVMTQYYDLRDANRRVDSFTQQVLTSFEEDSSKRQRNLEIAKAQGFNFDVE